MVVLIGPDFIVPDNFAIQMTFESYFQHPVYFLNSDE
jgi:hypothetical protein